MRSNCKSIVTGVVVGVVVVIWVAIKAENPGAVLMGISNFYALILIVLLMGYGIVEVPRSFWRAGSPKRQLQLLEFRASDLDMQLYDAEEAMKVVKKRVMQFEQTMKNEHDAKLLRCWSVVAEQVALDSVADDASAVKTGAVWSADDPLQWKLEKLAEINAEIRMAKVRVRRAQAEWQHLLSSTEELENVINKVSTPSSRNAANASGQSGASMMLESWRWYWMVHVGPNFNKVMAFVTAIMSILLLWCESSIAIPFRLSVFGEMIHASDTANVVGVQILVLLPLSYATWCTYSSLVKLKIPFIDALTLHENAQTDAYALLFNAGYMSRLQFGLGANFLMMLQYDSSGTMWPTALRDVVGQMNVDFLGESFTYVFPVSMFGVVLLLYFRVYDRILMLLGVDLVVGTGEPIGRGSEYDDKLQEGQMLIRTGRRKRDRRQRRVVSRDSSSARAARDETKRSRHWTRATRYGNKRNGDSYGRLVDADIA